MFLTTNKFTFRQLSTFRLFTVQLTLVILQLAHGDQGADLQLS